MASGDGILATIRDYTRSAQFTADAGARFRPAATVIVYGNASGDISVTSTTFADADSTNLAGSIACSGRPVALEAALIGAKGTTSLWLSFTWDGTEVTALAGGAARTDATAHLRPLYVVGAGFGAVPGAPRGIHRFSLVARVDGGTGTLYTSADQHVLLMAREI